MRRKPITMRRSKRLFRSGGHTAKLNLAQAPMRGGWRI